MAEIARFRIARAPQRLDCRDRETLSPDPKLLDLSDLVAAYHQAGDFLKSHELVSPTVQIPAPNSIILTERNDIALALQNVRRVDILLLQSRNKPKVKEFIREVFDTNSLITSKNGFQWLSSVAPAQSYLDTILCSFVVGSADSNIEPSLIADVTRLRIVIALMARLVRQPTKFKSPSDFEKAVRWIRLVFPDEIVIKPNGPMSTVFRIGFSDMYAVRQEWARYEAGEIAHIETVLPREEKERSHSRFEENEDRLTTATQERRSDILDSQNSQRFELSDRTQKEVDIAIGADASVDASGPAGPMQINAHVGGSLDFSTHDAEEHATKVARDSVSRAVTSIERSVSEVRDSRKLLRIEEINRHKLNNKSASPVNGIYRWVEKIDTVQMFRLPHRLLLEFQLPEPGAWMRWWRDKDNEKGFSNKKPKAFTKDGMPLATGAAPPSNLLTIDNMKDASVLNDLVDRYGVQGLTPPPQSKIVGAIFVQPGIENPAADKQPIDYYQLTNVAIPTDCQAVSWSGYVAGWQNRAAFPNSTGNIMVSVGDEAKGVGLTTPGEAFSGKLTGIVGGTTTGIVPIAIQSDSTRGLYATFNISCVPTDGAIRQWCISTYDRILDAYNELLRRHEEEKAARAVRSIGFDPSMPAARMQEIIREEMKRQVLEQLMGQKFEGWNGLIRDTTNEPTTDHGKVIEFARVSQFFEQAFEWEAMTYALYPQYWAPRGSWADLIGLTGPNSDYARFLRAGAARVVISARPTFADHVLFFLNFRRVWSGGPVPAPNDKDYLSVAEEIRSQTELPDDAIPGKHWEVRSPTTLAWLQDKKGLPRNTNRILPKSVAASTTPN